MLSCLSCLRQWLWSASPEDANGEKVRLFLSRVSEIVSHCAETKKRRGTVVESMNVMRTFATIALAVAVAFCVYAADQKVTRPSVSKYVPMGWTEDFDAARQRAAKDGKFVFAAFSGSDWCGPCMALEKEVFSQKGFLHKLSKRYVPVMLSSPSDRSTLSKLAIEQNDKLKKRYDVRGFPTMVVVNPADGKEVKRQSGDRSGSGADAYLERLADMMKGVEWPEAGGVANPLPKMEEQTESKDATASDSNRGGGVTGGGPRLARDIARAAAIAAWHTDCGEALKIAKATGKRLIVYNSWRLESEKGFALDPAFLSYATNRYVLVFVSGMGSELKDSYPWADSGGYPDCRIYESDGSPITIGRNSRIKLSGHDDDCMKPGGHMLELLKGFELARLIIPADVPIYNQKDLRPSDLARMHDLLSVLPETFVNHQYFYMRWAERLVAADPDGSRGWRACYPYVAKVLPRSNEFGRLKGEFYRKLYARARKRIADEGTKASGSNWDKHVGIAFGELADEWEPKFADIARQLEMMDSEVPNGDSRFKFDNLKSSVGNMLRRFQEGRQRH